jgi:hypothetical protein
MLVEGAPYLTDGAVRLDDRSAGNGFSWRADEAETFRVR